MRQAGDLFGVVAIHPGTERFADHAPLLEPSGGDAKNAEALALRKGAGVTDETPKQSVQA